jgi:hypothetical protein
LTTLKIFFLTDVIVQTPLNRRHWNVARRTTFGNWFSPFNRRKVFAAAVTSLNTINLAVVADSDPFVRTVR